MTLPNSIFDITCPYCQAVAGESCVSSTGLILMTFHAKRIAVFDGESPEEVKLLSPALDRYIQLLQEARCLDCKGGGCPTCEGTGLRNRQLVLYRGTGRGPSYQGNWDSITYGKLSGVLEDILLTHDYACDCHSATIGVLIQRSPKSLYGGFYVELVHDSHSIDFGRGETKEAALAVALAKVQGLAV